MKITLLAASAALTMTLTAAVAQTTTPNLIVIMADDLSVDLTDALLDGGWLPNIQQYLIDEGLSFDESFVTNALCCPSRATFLRGQYSHNHGIIVNRYGCETDSIALPGWLPTDSAPGRNASTLATWLQAQGYVTSFVGKYLNGYGEVSPPGGPADPQQYVPPGWDDWQGLISPSGYKMYDYELNDNGTVLSFGGAPEDYQTDVLAGRAVQFIQDRAAAGDAFFLSIMPFAPHIEILNPDAIPPCETGDPMADTIRPAPRHAIFDDGDPANGEVPALFEKASFDEADMSDKPACAVDPVFGPRCAGDQPRLPEPAKQRLRSQFKAMGASMLAVDDLVGSVMQELIAADLADDTVVIFTSDNGWFYGEHRLNTKDLSYEESIRVPLYVRAPGAPAPATVSRLVLNNDLAPTLAELAGVTPPYPPDGTSLVPLLNDPGAAWGRVRFLIEHFYQPPGNWARQASMRQKSAGSNFLYVQTYGDIAQPSVVSDREFYNLAIDPLQLDSFNLPTSVSANLDQLLGIFRNCSDALCRAAEGF